MAPRLTVLGSLNTDISVAVGRLPGPGETVLGGAAVTGAGGKGANQAVAAARLGASVRMVGCRGDDEFGRGLVAALVAEHVDVTAVRTVAGTASGLALITVDASGENTIAVAPGANALAGQQEAAAALAGGADVLVISAEVPVDAIKPALERARAARLLTVLNLAPVPQGARGLLGAGVDWLVVNAPEAGDVLGRPVTGLADARAAAAALAAAGARHAVVTRGAGGAVLDGVAGPLTVPGFRVASVDSVGAGDAFVAALGVAVAAGLAPADAVRAACAAGAAATTRRGAQTALPRPADVLAATGIAWPVPS